MEIYDRVRVISGEFEGETGIVTDIAEDKCFISLDGSGEDIRVLISECEIIDD